MKERIALLIKDLGVTSQRFAEIMGVQPSNISHILSGRNMPSFDFISKLLQTYPEINPDWLILGKGLIYRVENEEINKIEMKESLPLVEQELTFNEEETVQEREKEVIEEHQEILILEENKPMIPEISSIHEEKVVFEPKKELISAQEKSKQALEMGEEKEKNRTIERVLFFYDDATFEEFNPLKK